MDGLRDRLNRQSGREACWGCVHIVDCYHADTWPKEGSGCINVTYVLMVFGERRGLGPEMDGVIFGLRNWGGMEVSVARDLVVEIFEMGKWEKVMERVSEPGREKFLRWMGLTEKTKIFEVLE
jgi:hypothetical protein